MKKLKEGVKKLADKVTPKKTAKDNPNPGKRPVQATSSAGGKASPVAKVAKMVKKSDHGKKDAGEAEKTTEVEGLTGQEALTAESMRKRKATTGEE